MRQGRDVQGSVRGRSRGVGVRVAMAAAALALSVGGLLIGTAPSGANVPTSVTGASVCFGGEAGGGGCMPGTGGSTTAVAGQGVAYFEIGFTTPAALGTTDSVTIDASVDAPGLAFYPSQYAYDLSAGSTECTIQPNPPTFANNDQTVTLPIPSSCTATAGEAIEIYATNGGSTSPAGVTTPPNAGAYSVQVWTTQDPTPATTNTFTLTSAPQPPTGLQAAGGPGSATLQWVAPTDTGQLPLSANEVYCATTTPVSTSGTPLAQVAGSATGATVTGLTNGTTYSCVVTAGNDDGQSGPSNTATVTPQSVPDPPASPTVTSEYTALEVGWSPPDTDGGSPLLQYSVYCSSSGTPDTSGAPSVAAPPGATSATVTGLTNGISYACVVTATNAVGQSSATTEVAGTPDPTAPDAPSAPSATSWGAGQLIVGWTAPTYDGGSPITGYDVYCSTAATPDTSGYPSAPAGWSDTSALVFGLTDGTQYTCVVLTVNALGRSAPSAEVSATPSTVPDTPTAVSVTTGAEQVTVGWTPPDTDGGSALTGYDVYCSTSGTPATTGTPSATAAATDTSAVVTGLTDGTPVACLVVAVNADGPSLASAVASATPSTVPGPPTGLTATPGVQEIYLSWTAPASDGGSPLTGYDVYCVNAADPTFSTTPTATAPAGDTMVELDGLPAGVELACEVVAVNANGPSAPSSVVEATPKAPGPPACATTGVGSVDFQGGGYWLATADGTVASCGTAPFLGSPAADHLHLAAPIVGIAATPDHRGYWLVAADGGIFAFGDAHFYGSMGGHPLNRPIVGLATVAGGYYEVAADGGLFAFGSAHFYGSMGGLPLNRPVVGLAAVAGGYYEVAADGGLFAFGPGAVFYGSLGGLPLTKPVVGMAPAVGGGYYLVAADGGVFAFHAPFMGSTGCLTLNQPIVAITASAVDHTGPAAGCGGVAGPGGYQFVAADGGVFSFGTAVFAGSLAGTGIDDVVGMADSAGPT